MKIFNKNFSHYFSHSVLLNCCTINLEVGRLSSFMYVKIDTPVYVIVRQGM
jgi:hypothetical protein